MSFPQNGLLSALPYLGCSVTAVLSGQLADYLRESCDYPTAGVRKAFTVVGEASTPSTRAATNNYFLLVVDYSRLSQSHFKIFTVQGHCTVLFSVGLLLQV